MRLSTAQRHVIVHLRYHERYSIQWDGGSSAYIIPGWSKVAGQTMRILLEQGLVEAVTKADDYGFRHFMLTESGKREAEGVSP